MDLLAQVPEEFLSRHVAGDKGGMVLVDDQEMARIVGLLGHPPLSPATWRARKSSGTWASRSIMGEPTPMRSKEDIGKRLAGDRQAGGEEGFIVHLHQQRVLPGLGEGQVADLVDEVDPMEGALGFEVAF
jgi:hypothetical protein